MAVGGLGAYVIFTKQRSLLRILFHPVSEMVMLAFMVANILLVHGGHFDYRKNIVLSLVYVVFLMNISRNPRSKIKLESPLLNRLGRISYGIYMYHMPVIYGVLIAFHYLNFEDNSFIYNIALYAVVTVLTISAAQLSYDRFEQPFLRLKKRFTIVESGEQAVTSTASSP